MMAVLTIRHLSCCKGYRLAASLPLSGEAVPRRVLSRLVSHTVLTRPDKTGRGTRSPRSPKTGAPGRTRTCNLWLRRPLRRDPEVLQYQGFASISPYLSTAYILMPIRLYLVASAGAGTFWMQMLTVC